MVRPSVPTTGSYAAASPTAVVCPYLLADDGAWRASTAAREHRCTAVVPATALALDKQRRFCLVAEHATCATYVAATGNLIDIDEMVAARPSHGTRPGSRPIARTTPLVLDHGRVSVVVPALRAEPRFGQMILLGLMGLAFAAILVARLSMAGNSGGDAGATTNMAGGATASPTATATATARSTEGPAAASAGPIRTLVPTAVEPTPLAPDTVQPTGSPTTYKVKRGDTLSGIAARFGTTWQVLVKRNGIKDPSRLKVGQVLQLR